MKNSMFVFLLILSMFSTLSANGFELVNSQFSNIEYPGDEVNPLFADINDDGFLNLYITKYNDNHTRMDCWEQSVSDPYTFSRNITNFETLVCQSINPVITDIDGDGLKDLILGVYSAVDIDSYLMWYEQVSPGVSDFTLIDDCFMTIEDQQFVTPYFYDLDSDGKLDLLLGIHNGIIQHYEAVSPNASDFALVSSSFNGIDVAGYPYLTGTDLDYNGLLDLFVSSFLDPRNIIHYEQDMNDPYVFNFVESDFNSIPLPGLAHMFFTDLEGDGYPDLFTGYNSTIRQYSVVPHVSTDTLSSITDRTAVVGVTVTENSLLDFGDCGICWDTAPNPTVSDSVISIGSGAGNYSTTLTGLAELATYYVRGYAYDQHGLTYGENRSFHVVHTPMEITSLSCQQITGPVFTNSQDQPVVLVMIETSGIHDNLVIHELSGSASGSTNSSQDISSVKIYYTGSSPDFSIDDLYGSSGVSNSGYWAISANKEMQEGNNYFWVCFDLKSSAVVGHVVDTSIQNYWILPTDYEEFPNGDPDGSREIISFDAESGYALDFDGIDDMVEIVDVPELGMDDVFTVSAWIYPYDLESRHGIFSTRATNQAGSFQLEVGVANGGTNRVAVCGAGTWVGVTADNAIQLNEWNHIACTRSGSEAYDTKIYVNGEEMPLSGEEAYDLMDNGDPIRIGSGTNGGQLFNGKIDEVRFWNVARTEQEIREAMHLPDAGGFNELVANWQFNTGSGDTCVELTHGLIGTRLNMTDDDWVDSDIPFGSGDVDTEIEENGWVYFGATNLNMNYSSQSGAAVTVTRLDSTPNVLPSMADEAFDSQYWIVNRHDESAFDAELTFTVDEDITSIMAETPHVLKLFTRPINSSGEWSYLQTASYADDFYDYVKFPNITQTGQFMVGVVDLPYIVSMDPQDNQPDVHLGGIVRMEFNRDMSAGTGNITLKRSSDDSVIAQVAASEAKFDGCVVEADFNILLDEYESYYVQIEPGALMDVAYASPFTGIDDDTTWNFTTGSYTPALGTCIEFDGEDDYINLGHNPTLDLTEGITLECWVKPDEQTDWARIFSAPGTFTGKYGLSLSNSEGKVEACYRIEGGSSVYRKSFYPDITLNQWNHIAFAADNAGHGYLYINGVKMAAGANSSFSFTGEDLVLGAKQNNDYRFKGCLDEVRIWDYPRTQEQIAGNMCTPIDPLTPGLKCYLLMNEGVGDLATDIIGGNDGILNNMSRSGWKQSTIPYGEGSFQHIDIGEVGSYAFDQTGIDVDITSFIMMAEDTLEVYCTHLEEDSNVLPAGVDAVFDSQYWAIETWGDQIYQADVTFHVEEDVTAADEASPEILTLYWRSFGSDGDWVLHSRAIDASSADNTITFTGITSLSQFVIARNTNFPSPDGVPGYCLTFDGVDDYVELANEEAYDFATHFTAECWFKPTSTEEYFYCGIFGKDWEIMFEADPTMTSFMFDGSFCNFADFTDYEKSYLDRWSHIAVTYEFSADTWNGILSMYLNGELVATADGWDMVPDTSEPLFIGTDGNEYPTYFEGEIDQVRLWSVCRTQEEIREHIYNPVLGLEPGITAIFQLNEGTGMAVTDAINSMAGTLTNMDASDWVASTIPYGAGLSASAVEAGGIVEFNGTGITLDYTSQTGADVTVSRIEFAPNVLPDSVNGVFAQPYWIVNRYGTGDFSADITLTIDGLTPDDEANPGQIALFTRASNADDVWLYLSDASAVFSAVGEATFDGIEETGQFMITRWVRSINAPRNLAIEIAGLDVRISWDDVDGANSYRIFACDSIDGSFVDVTGSGSFELPTRATAGKKIELGRSVSSKKQVPKATRRSRKTWSMPFTGEMKFFYVLSSTETVE